MAIAIVFIAVGGVLVASALSGQSIADVFANFTGVPEGRSFDLPASGAGTGGDFPADPAAAGNVPNVDTNLSTITHHGLKGPNAAKLEALANVAEQRFHLSVGSVCRSAAHNAAVGGSDTSFHLQCRAFDSTGTVANRVAFARYAQAALSGVSGAEVFCDQAGMVAPGFDHSDHVHVGA